MKYKVGDKVKINETGQKTIRELTGHTLFPIDAIADILECDDGEAPDEYWYLCTFESYYGGEEFWIEQDWIDKVEEE